MMILWQRDQSGYTDALMLGLYVTLGIHRVGIATRARTVVDEGDERRNCVASRFAVTARFRRLLAGRKVEKWAAPNYKDY